MTFRARQNFLYDEYLNSDENSFKKVSTDVIDALEFFENCLKNETDIDKQKMLHKIVIFF